MGGNFFHGINVFYDFYRILGVSQKDSREHMHQVYHQKMVMAHEHRLEYAPLIQLAHSTVTGPGRANYDRQLAQAYRAGVIPVARYPEPETVMVLRDLLQEDGKSVRNHLAFLTKSRKTIGYTDDGFTKMERKYHAEPNEENKRKYQSWLLAKIDLLQKHNSFLWHRAGIRYEPVRPVWSPDDFRRETERSVSHIAELVEQTVAYTIRAEGTHPYLLAPPGTKCSLNEALDIGSAVEREIVDRALARLRQQTPELLRVARERKKTVEKMLSVMQWNYVGNRLPSSEILLLISCDSWIANDLLFDLNRPDKIPEQLNTYATQRTADVLLKFLDEGGTSVIQVNPQHLSHRLTVTHLLREHAKRIGNTRVEEVVARLRTLSSDEAPWLRHFT